ncbi:putative NLR family CARD domain-containing protein 4, partial [Apostichopus japonicus]
MINTFKTIMKLTNIVAVLTLFAVILVSAETDNGCEDPQIVEIGKSAILNCTFSKGFVGVFWYNSTNTDDDAPILVFQDSEKSGKGYSSGEFDIDNNGSLIVNNVSSTHDGIFTVSQIISLKGPIVEMHSITVITYVKPLQPYPSIPECQGYQHCLLRSSEISTLSCYVNSSRPNVSLGWTEHFTEGRINITTGQKADEKGVTFSSIATIWHPPYQISYLSLLTCSASDPLMLLQEDRSLVLIQNEAADFRHIETSKHYVEVGTVANLTCYGSSSGATLWTVSRNFAEHQDILAYGIFNVGSVNFTKMYQHSVRMQSNGALSLQNVKPRDDGLYVCVHRSSRDHDARLYDVNSYVKPNPPYVVVDGCNQPLCKLYVSYSDQLTCRLSGIRPITHLQWVSPYESHQRMLHNQSLEVIPKGDTSDVSATVRFKITQSVEGNMMKIRCRTSGPNSDFWRMEKVVDLKFAEETPLISTYPTVYGCDQQFCILYVKHEDELTCTLSGIRPLPNLEWLSNDPVYQSMFLNQSLEVTSKGDTTEVSVTVRFSIEPAATHDSITLTCRPVGPISEVWNMETIVDLRFPRVDAIKGEDNSPSESQLIFVIVFSAIVAVLLVIVAAIICVKRKSSNCKKNGKNIPTHNSVEEESAVMLQTREGGASKNNPGKLDQVINDLRETATDKVDDVNDVYVDVEIELLRQTDEGNKTASFPSDNARLTSYRDIFDPEVVKSKRIFLIANPGFGKSILFLQATLDWLNKTPPLNNVQSFVLLKLSDVTGCSSICEAIRKQIKGSFTSEDINDILSSPNVKSVIVLEDFDLYDDEIIRSEVLEIINGRKFSEVRLIISSRSLCIPTTAEYANIVRLRLNGFSEETQHRYLDKICPGDKSTATNLKDTIKKTMLLDEFCRIPLLFVKYIDIANDPSNKTVTEFHSITDLFAFVLTCYYNQYWKKFPGCGQEENESNFPALNKLCFESLYETSKQQVWEKNTFLSHVEGKCYKELISVGILREEESAKTIHDHNVCQKEVKFCHHGIVQWYASKYISAYTESGSDFSLGPVMKKIDPAKSQLFIRFCCGLSTITTEKMLKYFQSEGKVFQIFRILEQDKDFEKFIKEAQTFCGPLAIVLKSEEKRSADFQQSLLLQLLDIVSNSKIDLRLWLRLEHNFSAIEENTFKIILRSNLRLNIINNLEKLEVKGDKSELTTDNCSGILEYCTKCATLKSLAFIEYRMPREVQSASTLSKLQQRNVTVLWKTEKFNHSKLDLKTGRWKNIQTNEELRKSDHHMLIEYLDGIISEDELKRK